MAASARQQGELISGINVTPMVDVVLVLLIVLMVAASYTVSQALPVELPEAQTGEATPSTPLAITIEANGALHRVDPASAPKGRRATPATQTQTQTQTQTRTRTTEGVAEAETRPTNAERRRTQNARRTKPRTRSRRPHRHDARQ